MITLSIDVTLLDKARIKEFTRKNGNKAKFLELVLIDTPDGKFGDYMVKQQCSKEERLARIEMPILGNGKNIVSGGGKSDQRQSQKPNESDPWSDDDDVPFN